MDKANYSFQSTLFINILRPSSRILERVMRSSPFLVSFHFIHFFFQIIQFFKIEFLDFGKGWLTLFPPLFTILLSILTRQVVPSLLFGIFVGVTFRYKYNPIFGITRSLDFYLPRYTFKSKNERRCFEIEIEYIYLV